MSLPDSSISVNESFMTMASRLLWDDGSILEQRHRRTSARGRGDGAGRTHPPISPRRQLPSSIEELFKCYICFESLAQPMMCPHCAKLGCHECITRWLQQENAKCPHCRAYLPARQLVSGRFVQDLEQQLREAMVTGTFGVNGAETPKSDTECAKHTSPLQYRCEDCASSICADCIALEPTHRTHRLERLADVSAKHQKEIANAVKEIEDRTKYYEAAVHDAEARVAEIERAKLQILSRHAVLLEEARRSIEDQTATKLDPLLAFKGKIRGRVEILRSMLARFEEGISGASDAKVVETSGHWIGMLKETSEQLKDASPPNISTSFSSDFVPDFQTGTFLIDNYSRSRDSGESRRSPVLIASGMSWRLKVHCGGSPKAPGFLSIFLELLSDLTSPARYEYKIEMVGQRPEDIFSTNCVCKESCSEFSAGESWGFNRFYPVSDLESNGFWASSRDVIELRFSVRANSYAQKCRDLERYIKQLETLPASTAGDGPTPMGLAIRELEKNSFIIPDSVLPQGSNGVRAKFPLPLPLPDPIENSSSSAGSPPPARGLSDVLNEHSGTTEEDITDVGLHRLNFDMSHLELLSGGALFRDDDYYFSRQRRLEAAEEEDDQVERYLMSDGEEEWPNPGYPEDDDAHPWEPARMLHRPRVRDELEIASMESGEGRFPAWGQLLTFVPESENDDVDENRRL